MGAHRGDWVVVLAWLICEVVDQTVTDVDSLKDPLKVSNMIEQATIEHLYD